MAINYLLADLGSGTSFCHGGEYPVEKGGSERRLIGMVPSI
jgi:hypothetical protein